jgi:hypothetical protein
MAIQLVNEHPTIDMHLLPQSEKLNLLKFSTDDPRVEYHRMHNGSIVPPVHLPGFRRFPKWNTSKSDLVATDAQATRIQELYKEDLSLFDQSVPRCKE